MQRRGQSYTGSFWLPPETEQTGSPGGCPTYAGWNTPSLQCPGQLSSSSSLVCDQKLTFVCVCGGGGVSYLSCIPKHDLEYTEGGGKSVSVEVKPG